MPRHIRRRNTKRRGTAAILTVVAIPVLIGFTALAVDVGVLYNARAEAQRAADAAALAGAWELLDEDRLTGTPEMSLEEQLARQSAAEYAARNMVRGVSPEVDLNTENLADGDVVVGYLYDPTNLDEALSTALPNQFNSVFVRVRRDTVLNGPVQLLFAGILGFNTSNVQAEATATFKDGIVGYKVESEEEWCNADLLPYTLLVTTWEGLLDGTHPKCTDDYTVTLNDPDDPSSIATVTSGPDGIGEINLFPGAGATQLPPGNSGTVDICNPNNSTSDIARQILYGINADDFSYCDCPGELRLGEDGTVVLNGDTGISAGVKDELAAIIGHPRGIPLFSEHDDGPGNNADYTIVGFGGIRIVNVRLTGSKHTKEVVIQPGYVVDNAAITGPGSGSSYYVYAPVRLTR